MPRTTLPWAEYKPKALKLKQKGLKPTQIYQQLGTPYWEGKDWKLESDGKGGHKRTPRETLKIKRTRNERTRQQRDVTKTPEEGRQFSKLKRQASAQSDELLHQITYAGRPSIAEHDVALQAGGSKEHGSISDPDFKDFKDSVEAYVYRNKPKYVVDLDNVSGGVRLIFKTHHNKFQPTSQQPGRTIEQYEDWKPIVDAMPIVTKDRQLEETLKTPPQERVNLPQQTPPMTQSWVGQQLGGFATDNKVPERQPEPKPDPRLAPQVMSAQSRYGQNSYQHAQDSLKVISTAGAVGLSVLQALTALSPIQIRP